MSELQTRITWAELLGWVEFYLLEQDEQRPPERRRVRPQSKQEAAAALDSLFGLGPQAKRNRTRKQ